MLIVWTTVGTREEAERIAQATVARGLAACVQIDGPVTSVYAWQGRIETAEEFRLTLKCLPEQLPALETFVLQTHPYETPEWVAVEAAHVGEKYLSWARAGSNSSSL